jgi:prepilin-type N-terminal cleavage/methylation domain-containing protein
MNINLPRPSVQRGFTLMEAMVAMLITSFGLLALAGINLKLARNEDVAKQRSEAVRLAQERIEALRSFTQIDAAAGALAWSDLATGSDSISGSASYHTNTSYTRSWRVMDAPSDPVRRVQVTMDWTDRVGEAQSVTFSSMISKTDPSDVGSLGFPLPANTTLKRPKNRSLNIPMPAVDLGNGDSAVPMTVAGTNYTVVFSNETGYVVKLCQFTVNTAADLASCPDTPAYIIAGYVSLNGTNSFPSGLAINTGLITGATETICSLTDALDQNKTTNNVIAGYKYYLCVVRMINTSATWSGKVRLVGSGLNSGPNYLVCRFQFPSATDVSNNQLNVQPYTNVNDSLDNQNYVITTNSSCPTVTSLATTLHQNCRSSNPNSNANRSTDCPAS